VVSYNRCVVISIGYQTQIISGWSVCENRGIALLFVNANTGEKR
jgi:hypothetical protein